MFKKCFVAAAIVMASSACASAQDIFWSFSPTELVTTSNLSFDASSGSAYIFSDGLFGFDAIDLDFTLSDSSPVRFTGGEAFDSPFSVIGGTMFDFTEITIDGEGSSGNLFSVSVTQNGVDPAVTSLFNPNFVAGVGPNGAVLLARVDFDVVGTGTADLEFELGLQGAIDLPDEVLNPSFGSATLTLAVQPLTPYCPFAGPDELEYCIPLATDYSLGDVNLSGNLIGDGYIDIYYSVDVRDIAPFIAVLASQGYQREADCNQDDVVNFLDIAPFIEILNNPPVF